jgi:hypothetical protein
MSDAELEQTKAARSTKRKRFWIGSSLATLFVFSAINIFLLAVVAPKFEQIYAEMIPGQPLPSVMELVITGRIAVAVVSAFWPIFGAVLLRQQTPYAKLCINVGILWMFLQIGVTIFALFIPVTGCLITGVPDSNHP